MWYAHIIEYYSILKKTHAITQKNFEDILREISQLQYNKYYTIHLYEVSKAVPKATRRGD